MIHRRADKVKPKMHGRPDSTFLGVDIFHPAVIASAEKGRASDGFPGAGQPLPSLGRLL